MLKSEDIITKFSGNKSKKLFKVAEDGNVKKLKELLEDKEVDVNQSNPKENEDTPLHAAAKWNRSEVVEILLSKGADVDKPNDDNQTPLMLAVLNNYKDTTAEMLIRHGADINKTDKNGKKPIHMACKKYGVPALVKLLIKYGADVNEPEKNAFENTPLHLAAMNHSDFGFLGSNAGNEANIEIATILLKAGADPELKNAKGQTVMELAESRGNHGVVEILKNFPQKKLYETTISVLTQPRNTLSKKVLGNQHLNSEIKKYLGGSSKKAGRKTRKVSKKPYKK